MLKEVALRSGIRKDVNPHNFRHSRASYLANKLKEPQMRMFFGWAKDSDMTGTYVHLSGRDIDDAILEVHGMKNHEPQSPEKTLATKTCPRCEKVNGATDTICLKCGLPLNEKEMMEIGNKNKIMDIVERIIEAKLEEKMNIMS